MIHLMELPNPDPLTGRPEHGGRDRHTCIAIRDVSKLKSVFDKAGESSMVSTLFDYEFFSPLLLFFSEPYEYCSVLARLICIYVCHFVWETCKGPQTSPCYLDHWKGTSTSTTSAYRNLTEENKNKYQLWLYFPHNYGAHLWSIKNPYNKCFPSCITIHSCCEWGCKTLRNF